MKETNLIRIEVRSYELDAYGHVNNAVYVNWLEHGRLAYLRDRDMTYTSIPEEFGCTVVVVHTDISYHRPLHLGDVVDIASKIVRLGSSSFTFEQEITFEDGRTAVRATVTMACVGSEGRAVPIPAELRTRMGGTG